ncbi:MAG: hypothetical protein PHU08_07960, partial [Dehalococcoidales bacterium]|nr:hypothetical protein [Dehalococcoidales bacterium]
MLVRTHQSKIVMSVAAVLVLAVVTLTATYTQFGITCQVGTECGPATSIDFAAIPPAVAEDAVNLAVELFGDYKDRVSSFVRQLLSVYLEAQDKDFVMVFNSGGWGWTTLEQAHGWQSIFDGIKSELDRLNYSTLELNYLRTANDWRAPLDEMAEMVAGYPTKARDLAYRVRFLTTNIPGLKVIIAGESNGTVICNRVMDLLRQDAQIYSIQTGPPFWHQSAESDRTLVITDNGVVPDSFSRGDTLTIIWSNLKSLFGLDRSQEVAGAVFNSVKAPGHDYG